MVKPSKKQQKLERDKKIAAAQMARNKKASENLQKFIKETAEKRANIATGKIKKVTGEPYSDKEQTGQQELLNKSKQQEIAQQSQKEREEQWAKEDSINRPTKKQLADRSGERYKSPEERVNPERFDRSGKRLDTEPTLWKGTPPSQQNVPIMTSDQMDAAEEMLQAYRNAYPDIMSRLSESPETGMSKQLQGMFGHMTNPVLQGLMGGGQQGYNQNNMFPSQMQNQMNPGIEGLLGMLGQQGGQWMGQKAQNLPGNFMSLLSSLGNRFRGQQQ